MERYLKDEPGTAASCAALRKTESFEMLSHLALALEHPVTAANSPMWPWTATVVKQEPSSESSVTTDPEEDDDDTTEESDDQLRKKHDIALR